MARLRRLWREARLDRLGPHRGRRCLGNDRCRRHRLGLRIAVLDHDPCRGQRQNQGRPCHQCDNGIGRHDFAAGGHGGGASTGPCRRGLAAAWRGRRSLRPWTLAMWRLAEHALMAICSTSLVGGARSQHNAGFSPGRPCGRQGNANDVGPAEGHAPGRRAKPARACSHHRRGARAGAPRGGDRSGHAGGRRGGTEILQGRDHGGPGRAQRHGPCGGHGRALSC